MADLRRMFKAQHELQLALGSDVEKMSDEERVQYIKDQVLACTDELHEMLQEVGWKPWAISRHIDEEKAFGELRDAWQHLTNLMLAVIPGSPEQLADRLEIELYQKHLLNYQRMSKGYDGVHGKCPSCHRALDETPTHEIKYNDGYKTYCVCGHLLGVSSVPA